MVNSKKITIIQSDILVLIIVSNICTQYEKSNDTITTYYCPRDGWFRTFPDAECSKVCRRTMRFDQAFDYYQKSIQKNG